MAFADVQGEQMADLASPFVSDNQFHIPVNGLNLGAIMQPYTDNSSQGGYGVEGVSRLFGSQGGGGGSDMIAPAGTSATAFEAVSSPKRLTNADNKRAILIGVGLVGGITILGVAVLKKR